jgi:predicted  nucleic acid-binding Zn-ribbon protein
MNTTDKTILEIARTALALNGVREQIADVLDISDSEVTRIQESLNDALAEAEAEADRIANRAHTHACALRMFETELKDAMKYFKTHSTATAYNHLKKSMLVWQQFDQLNRKPSLTDQLNKFLDDAPKIPMGTWGDFACVMACGTSLAELAKS